jgi:hypothetical protein
MLCRVNELIPDQSVFVPDTPRSFILYMFCLSYARIKKSPAKAGLRIIYDWYHYAVGEATAIRFSRILALLPLRLRW